MRPLAPRLIGLLWAALLVGCASHLPARTDQAASYTRVAPASTPLAGVSARGGLEAGATAAWPLPESAFALDARLAAIEHATTAVDIQTYLLADDATGRQLLRALRDAAARGVRVRLLVDDIYTAGLDLLLMGFVGHPNAEVRLFNPFITERASSGRRLMALLADFHRLDHRMHNKLFVADGAVAIVGGRNMADEYFLRGRHDNFFDVDVLLVGAIVPELAASFDRYWNSEQAYDLRTIVAATHAVVAGADELRADFDRRTTAPAPETAVPPADQFGAPPFRTQLANGQFRLVRVASASAYADPPEKATAEQPVGLQTVADRFLTRLDEADQEVVLFSPYFIPDAHTTARLRALRDRGVPVHAITNSLAVSDEPLAIIGLERHQRELLAMGVELYELSAERVKLDTELRTLLGSSIGRLHAKMAMVDRRLVYIGSLNLDSRSSRINTELGVRIESAEIATMLSSAFRIQEAAGVVRVRLQPDGHSLAWSVRDADGHEQPLDHEPDGSWSRRFRLRLLGLLVPEQEL